MSLEEFEENIDPKTKRYILRKSIMDLGMGLIYIIVGFMKSVLQVTLLIAHRVKFLQRL
jgi:hypothetical protein